MGGGEIGGEGGGAILAEAFGIIETYGLQFGLISPKYVWITYIVNSN